MGKTYSKTQLFKMHLQAIIADVTGKKLSQDKAWELYKAMQAGTLEFVFNQEDKKLSLAGLGRFEIKETKPSGKKAGMVRVLNEDGTPKLDEEGHTIEVKDETLPVWDVVPRYKFYPSTATDEVLYSLYNCPGEYKEPKHYGLYAKGELDLDVEAPQTPYAEGTDPEKVMPAVQGLADAVEDTMF